MGKRWISWGLIAGVVLSCESKPKKLSPRMMKEVDNEFRKMKKELREETDSLCSLYQEKNLERIVDSLIELRILQDKQNRDYIEE